MKYGALTVFALALAAVPALSSLAVAQDYLRLDKPKQHRQAVLRNPNDRPWYHQDWNPKDGAKPSASFGPARHACQGCSLGFRTEPGNYPLPRNGIDPFK